MWHDEANWNACECGTDADVIQDLDGWYTCRTCGESRPGVIYENDLRPRSPFNGHVSAFEVTRNPLSLHVAPQQKAAEAGGGTTFHGGNMSAAMRQRVANVARKTTKAPSSMQKSEQRIVGLASEIRAPTNVIEVAIEILHNVNPRKLTDSDRSALAAACIFQAYSEIGAPKTMGQICETFKIERGVNMKLFNKAVATVLDCRAKATNRMIVAKVDPGKCVDRIISALDDKENMPKRLRGMTLDLLEKTHSLAAEPAALACGAVAVALSRESGTGLKEMVKRVSGAASQPMRLAAAKIAAAAEAIAKMS